jgi:hypothetical protein
VGIPFTVGFRPQLVVSDLFGGNPFDGGILGFHGAFGYHEALSQSPPLSLWNFGYQIVFHKFSFTMELWLLQSLSHELFDRILAITKPSARTFR